jgi:hypothetical protein
MLFSNKIMDLTINKIKINKLLSILTIYHWKILKFKKIQTFNNKIISNNLTIT